MMTATSTTDTPAREPALSHDDAVRLAAGEYARMIEVLTGLPDDVWTRPTDCTAWDVRQLASHLVGMAATTTSPEENGRQQALAHQAQSVRGGPFIDSLTALQVSEREGRSPAEIVAEAVEVVPRAVLGRTHTPVEVRGQLLPIPQHVNGVDEPWTIGYLLDVILTRDPWMHRIDLSRATGSPLDLTAEHDGVIVDDVVREWAGRHGRPYRLELTGPAGGSWSNGAAETITLDAVEFCRIISGRGQGTGLLSTQVPF